MSWPFLLLLIPPCYLGYLWFRSKSSKIDPHAWGLTELEPDISIGLPPQLAQKIVEAKLKGPISWLTHWAGMLIMITGFAVGAFLWYILDKFVDAKTITAAQAMDGFAYETNFGVGLLIGLFVWLLTVSLILSILILKAPPRIKETLFLNSKSDFIGSKPKIFGLHHILDDPAKFKTGSDYIDAVCRKMISILLKFIIPGLALVVGICWLETSWYKIYTPTHVVKNGFLTNTLEKKRWRNVASVELGCNFVEKRTTRRKTTPASNNIIYKVQWPDGSKASLDIDNQINGKSWLDNFETVDAQINSGDAIFRRWVWLERNSLHPTCLRYYYSKHGKARIDRLLRIGELP